MWDPRSRGRTWRGRWGLLLACLLVFATGGAAVAAFTGSTDSAANSVMAETLDPPTGLTASLNGADIVLDWSTTPDAWASGYEIWRATSQGGPFAYHDSVVGQATTTYTDVGARSGGPYHYVARAEYMSWRSADSNEDSIAPVAIVGSWSNPALTYTPDAGTDRLLVFIAAVESGIDRDLTAVAYGGRPLTAGPDVVTCDVACARAEMWYLNEAGIQAAVHTRFTVTWTGDGATEEHYSAVTLEGVDQTTPLGDTSTNTSTGDPIQVSSALSVTDDDVVLVAAMSGNPGAYTPDTGYTEGVDTTDWTSTMATAHLTATGAGTEQPSMDFNGTANRQVILSAVVNTTTPPTVNTWSELDLSHAPSAGTDRLLVFVAGLENASDRDLTLVNYGGQAMTQAVEAVICNTFCARTEAWVLDEAGIAAANSDEFAVTWSGGAYNEIEEHYGAVMLEHVDQASPTGDTSTNSSTSDPIQVSAGLAVVDGDLVLVASTGGNPGSYTPDAGYTEGFDGALYSSTTAAATLDPATGTEQPSMSFDGTINRQTIVAVGIAAA